jgi:hypothetical protein
MGRRSATSVPRIIGVLDHTILKNGHLQHYLYDLLILQPISAKKAVQYNPVLNPHVAYPPTQPLDKPHHLLVPRYSSRDCARPFPRVGIVVVLVAVEMMFATLADIPVVPVLVAP